MSGQYGVILRRTGNVELGEAVLAFRRLEDEVKRAKHLVGELSKAAGIDVKSILRSPPRTGPDAVAPRVGSNTRLPGGSRSRFVGGTHHADRARAALPADHRAVVQAQSLFHKSVVDPKFSPRVLVSGHNNSKLGRTVEKGSWKGMPIFQLTLEERATCPTSCTLWRECYGNTLHLARRHKHGPALIIALRDELDALNAKYPNGFVVRLHVLGDFYSVPYVDFWGRMLVRQENLHVWGYTAWGPETPIGARIAQLNEEFPGGWVVRESVGPDTEPLAMQVTTIWRQPEGPSVDEGMVCPQQFDRTATCGTCGLCWSPAHRNTRIVFVGHGRNTGGKSRPVDAKPAPSA